MVRGKKKKVCITIPTYNEKENIEALLHEILALRIPAALSILVVDDNSPDGTGEVVRSMAKKDRRIHLLLRKKRRGRGAAGIDGFKAAIKLNADYIIEMDGDFSHQPRFIPLLLENAGRDDVVIGSRFIPGGKDAERSLIRKGITYLVRNFVRRQFQTPVIDVSSGFRCFKREVFEKLDLDDLISVGPSLVLEILYKISLMNFKIGEVPIVFIERKAGRTKLSLLTLLETLVMVFKFKKAYPPSSFQKR